jgi:tagatose 1,6-diphosphate aldolase
MTNTSPLDQSLVSTRLSDVGKQRSLQRVVSEDGLFHVLAIDHLSDFAELLSPDPSMVGFSDVVRAKDAVIRTAMDSVSAVLVDARYGGHLVHAGSISRSTGLMMSLEDEDYAIPPGSRRTRLRAGWSIQQAKLAGVDVAKLLWFFRPDADSADNQLELLESLVAASVDLSIPLLVEPIWYPLHDEDPSSDEWKAGRIRGIIESAVIADRCGIDVLKVEFPGYVDTPAGRSASVDAVNELNERTSAPWVVLSAGVDYDDFATQIEIASEAGSSGYVAGRSIWRDALLTRDPGKRESAIAEIKHRFDHLNGLTRRGGRRVDASRPLDDVLTDVDVDWYQRWHPPVS